MQVRKLHHIGILGHVLVAINVLQRKNLVRVLLELDDPLLGSLGIPSAVTDDGLFVFVLRDGHGRLLALRFHQRSRNPSILGILDEDQ